ncbi:MAG: hypothetical protein ACT4PT_01935, partial [Methanobacteriota archaeon]
MGVVAEGAAVAAIFRRVFDADAVATDCGDEGRGTGNEEQGTGYEEGASSPVTRAPSPVPRALYPVPVLPVFSPDNTLEHGVLL